MTKLKQFWIDTKTSFWFIPTILNIFLIGLALLVIRLDHYLAPQIDTYKFPFLAFEQEEVRTFLSTIAGSMITLAGVVFSITILVLAQTASQYTPLILRNFMRKRTNQFVLGLFVGNFIFCLFMLTNLHPTNNIITMVAGFSLAVTGVGFLIFFIHHTSTSIQASEIIIGVTDETLRGIEKHFYANSQEEKSTPSKQMDLPSQLLINKTGYIQSINISFLLDLANRKNGRFKLLKRVGNFVIEQEPICLFSGDFSEEEIRKAFAIGSYRTAEQDTEFGIQQLVDIALKGLSPGVNDLSTAQAAIHYLGSIYVKLASLEFGKSYFYENEILRLEQVPITFEHLIKTGFASIIENAIDKTSILISLSETLYLIEKSVTKPERKNILQQFLAKTDELLSKKPSLFLHSQ